MKNFIILFIIVLFTSCYKYEQTQLIIALPNKLAEASGVEIVKGSNLLWMQNDSGNKNEIYGVNKQGKIIKTINVKAKNNDWEDLTTDNQGNLYIADFGNNKNNRKDLVILKISNQDLLTKKTVEVEKIKFSYPDQYRFPPRKKERFFDAESVFWLNNNLYIFTKSRVKKLYGKTRLYKIPAKKGTYVAEFISEFNTCNNKDCWITSADISPNRKKVALLTHDKVLVFSNFTEDNFFNGKLIEYDLGFASQKEGLTFKDDNTLYINDEQAYGKGGKVYKFKLE